MDPEVFKQRQDFMKRARENLTKGNPLKPITQPPPRDGGSGPPPKVRKVGSTPSIETKTFTQPTANVSKFAVQTRLLKYMKERHLQGDDHPLSIEEAFDEMNERNVPPAIIRWLIDESLPQNPKIEMSNNSRFRFKPRYDVHNRRELRNLIEEHFINGKGTIMLGEIKECYAEAERHVNKMGDQVYKFIKTTDKEVSISYNPTFPGFDPQSDKEKFRTFFHSINIDSISSKRIDEFLEGHEFDIVKGATNNSQNPLAYNSSKVLKRPSSNARKKRPFKLKSNAHLENMLDMPNDDH